MSGETETRPSGWTTDTLKEYFEQRLTDQDKAVQAALIAQKEAVIKAENATEKRFESVNEFRKTLSDQTSSFLPRPEYDANHKALDDKIDSKTEVLVGLIQALTDRMNIRDGTVKGSEITMGKIYAAIGAVGAVLGIIVLLANKVF